MHPPLVCIWTKVGAEREMLEGRATIQTLTIWKTASTRTVWALTKIKSCTWDGIIQAAVQSGIWLASQLFLFQLCWEGPWDSGEEQAKWISKASWQQQRQIVSWATSGTISPAERGMWLCHLTQLFLNHAWNTACSFGPPGSRHTLGNWREFRRGPVWWLEGWRTWYRKKGWRFILSKKKKVSLRGI